jgi:hypothetical protein
LKVFGEVVHVDEFIYGGEARAGNYVFQLADVPRPTALEQNGLGSARQPLDLLAISIVAFLEKHFLRKYWMSRRISSRRSVRLGTRT